MNKHVHAQGKKHSGREMCTERHLSSLLLPKCLEERLSYRTAALCFEDSWGRSGHAEGREGLG